MDLLCEIKIFGAKHLPRTDKFSKIDPYVIVKVGAETFRTSKRDDEDFPVWNETFMLYSSAGPNGLPSSLIKFEVWDSDVFKDTHACNCELDLVSTDPRMIGMVELPLQPTKTKYANKGDKCATLTVGVTGWINAYPKLRSLVANVPGVIFNDMNQRLYVPVGPTGLYVAVEYEKDAVDIKLYLTVPNPNVYLDMMLQDRQRTKMRRRIYQSGHLIYQNLVAYQELKIDDLALSTDFRGLMVMSFTKLPIMTMPLDKVVSAHGWRGSLGYEGAKRQLHNIDVDDQEQEIYMSVEQTPPLETFLIVDWDKGDVDIKLGVLSIATTGTKGFDLTINQKDAKTTSEIFLQPKQKLRGKFLFSRIFELDDVPYGTSFSDMVVSKYELRDLQQWSVQSIVPIRPM